VTVLLLTLALGCAGGAAWLVATDVVVGRSQRTAAARLSVYGRGAEAAVVPVSRRGPKLVAPLARLTLRLAPGRDRGRTAEQLQAAGFNASRTDAFLALKSGLAFGLGGLAVIVGLGAGRVAVALFGALAAAAVGLVLPDMIVARRARSRRDGILRALPNALDLLAVIVEAGLGLDAALARYADRAEGPLAEELSLLVAELRVGSSRASVFKSFAERFPAPEIQSFVRAIVTADQLGVSLSRTLRVQAQDARVRRQMIAEQRANKTPVKILFPTVFCIFPALFIVVLAPAVLAILKI
jgi:tight adherence protein C